MFASSAPAQQNCSTDREQVLTRLAEKYGETRRSVMLATQGVFEIWANRDTGTWTVLLHLASGMTCMMASGRNYEEVDDPLQPTGMKI